MQDMTALHGQSGYTFTTTTIRNGGKFWKEKMRFSNFESQNRMVLRHGNSKKRRYSCAAVGSTFATNRENCSESPLTAATFSSLLLTTVILETNPE